MKRQKGSGLRMEYLCLSGGLMTVGLALLAAVCLMSLIAKAGVLSFAGTIMKEGTATIIIGAGRCAVELTRGKGGTSSYRYRSCSVALLIGAPRAPSYGILHSIAILY